ncbi:MAG: NAD(P)-dependent oxidoreductase [Ruminiclostridium sp.]|nr:NAD(P)-dependent oxidoreductase [Ruminiclostridium sp.]
MKKILVTGSEGYIGRHVTDFLLDEGYDVICSDISGKYHDERCTVCDYPIFSGDKDVFCKTGSPDILIHLAWQDGFIHNSEAHMSNLPCHKKFIKDMLAGGLKSLTVMGTMHEIGYHEGAVTDNTPCNPLSQYGKAKNDLRLYLTELIGNQHSDTAFHWLRAFYIYGDDRRNNSVFTKLLSASEKGETTFPFTSGRNSYDFIHVKELARQIGIAALDTEKSGIINCCSGKATPIGAMAEKFIEDNGLSVSLLYGSFPDREYDSPLIYGDNEKITELVKDYYDNKG